MKPIFVNPFSIQRGAICVLRVDFSSGVNALTAFQIAPRANWQEWGGAFSILF
jgi:hypothetical protein